MGGEMDTWITTMDTLTTTVGAMIPHVAMDMDMRLVAQGREEEARCLVLKGATEPTHTSNQTVLIHLKLIICIYCCSDQLCSHIVRPSDHDQGSHLVANC